MANIKKRKKKKKQKGFMSSRLLIGMLALLLLLLIVMVLAPGLFKQDTWQEQHEVAVAQPAYEDVQAMQPRVENPAEKKLEKNPESSVVLKEPKVPVRVEKTEIVHGIALVIDDVGYDMPALRRILALPFPTAISIIPEAPYAKKSAKLAHESGHTVMLHMPMEPANPHYRARMDASFLSGEMSKDVVQTMLLKGLNKVPYAQGINNHMGSLLTSMKEPMAWVMQFCKQQGLFFIDSKTSAKSVAASVARQYGLTWGKRRVFLDHTTKLKDMKLAWAAAQKCAKQRGGCIVIAHPHAETLNFLEQHVSSTQYKKMKKVDELLHES
ncbi:MAG: divergent polysaccharide deacetylase family protein [Mariprofundaceae bacterium]